MKRFFFLLSAVIFSLTIAAQMQVWSNGTIIFSHNQTDVDSISFGSPIQVQTNMQSASTPSTLAGSVYISSLFAGSTNSDDLYTLCFLDDGNGYYTRNESGDPESIGNFMTAFTYSISGSNITIKIGSKNRTGKLIGKNAIVISNWYISDSYTMPATFLNYNR